MTSPNTLAAAIDNSVLYQLMNIHTAFPARVISYDYTTRKATLQPLIDKKYRDGTTQPMPKLNNVPVIMPQAGSFFVNYPVNAGDTCLVMCCERSIDAWLQNGQQAPPNDPRKFDLSDAVAIMGLSPFSVSSLAANNSDVVIGYAGSKITIRSNGDISINTSNRVAMGSNAGLIPVEVLDIISKMLDILENSVTTALGAPIIGGVPVVGPYALLKTAINSIKGTL